MKKTLVAPSILSANFSNISNGIDIIHASGADLVHLDVMDGQFVSNLTFGPQFIQDLRPLTKLPLDVHLMIMTPHRMLSEFIEAGSDILTFHWEAEVHHHRWVEFIHERGIKAGISLVPSTPVEVLFPILPFLDNVLIMTVNPGFGGQSFLPFCLSKVQKLAEIRLQQGLNFTITVDGGVNEKTGLDCKREGADILVTGSSFFNHRHKADFVRELRGE